VPKRKHHYFPCINDHQVIEEEKPQEPKAITLIFKSEYLPDADLETQMVWKV
jgi:hypothetical protein